MQRTSHYFIKVFAPASYNIFFSNLLSCKYTITDKMKRAAMES